MKIFKINKETKTALKQVGIFGSLFLFAACGAVDSSDADGGTPEVADVFPTDLAVASPTDVTEDDGTTNLTLSSIKFSGAPSFIPTYAQATADINEILTASSASLCKFDPELFLSQEHDADCYGPSVDYTNHPDASSTDPRINGELPPGDLGIWEESDAATGHACMAAELNARLSSVGDKSKASLSGLASLICVVNVNGYSMPSSSTLDLLSDMNALAIPDVTFTTAEIAHALDGSGSDQYSYELEFEYSPGSDSYDVVVSMEHTPGATATEYTGQVSYLVNDSVTGGNCPTSDVTANGSLQYVRRDIDDMDTQVKNGIFCWHDSDGRDGDGLVDPSQKYDVASNPTGWGNNFSILTANYDPTTLLGNYAYSWQAGPEDDNTRAFNLFVEQMGATTDQHALAFFGYGEDIETTDGSIQGFICNWAGPSADHTLLDYSQYQEVEYDGTTGTFISVASNIEYAPTVSCEYDGSASFIYDTNGDGSLTDETHAAVTQDLYPATDTDGDGNATMEETIDALGFTIPVI